MGPLMLDVAAYELDAEDKEVLEHPLVGGIILFSRNFHDIAQLCALVKDIRQSTRSDVLIAVDHEGGRVQRFKNDFSVIPAMADISNVHTDVHSQTQSAQQLGWLMAMELLSVDIDISFAPVLDLYGNSDVIGDRSFHADKDQVIRLGGAFLKGMHSAGMKATGKHFPGHGNVKEDSHIALPIDKREKDVIFAQDMHVFSVLNQQGLLDAVMPAHVIYPAVDDLPAGFSSVWVQNVLRQTLNFDGVVFSDDLSMQGAVHLGSYTDRAVAAFAAGCDMALICNDRKGAVEVLDQLDIPPVSHHRTKRMLKQMAPNRETLVRSDQYKAAIKHLNFHYDS